MKHKSQREAGVEYQTCMICKHSMEYKSITCPNCNIKNYPYERDYYKKLIRKQKCDISKEMLYERVRRASIIFEKARGL